MRDQIMMNHQISWELMAIAVFALLLINNRKACRASPGLMITAITTMVIGLMPQLDIVARHSVWLHCLQSALIHHVAPMLLLMAELKLPSKLNKPFAQILASPLASSLIMLSFLAMSVMWVWPELHIQLMHDGSLYRAMKWAMAISGVLLCYAAAILYQQGFISSLRFWVFHLAITVPQVLVGILLMMAAPLYPMPQCLSKTNGLVGVLIKLGQSLGPRADQALGGALLLISATLFFVLSNRFCDFLRVSANPVHR
ncbi:cytochrome c oxidase assembly protein [Methylophilus glucosoxydans]|uniref:Cytochrome c oxidase assembly protein n=1 Tax=Methylophilus glucosoxydans TaxID=752553 RepID=A0ABW3GCT9_9PROT